MLRRVGVPEGMAILNRAIREQMTQGTPQMEQVWRHKELIFNMLSLGGLWDIQVEIAMYR